MKKTIIVIDGQNLSYDLRAMGLRERDIDWTKLFNEIVGNDSEFVRAYWFRPDKISGAITQKDFLEELVVRKKFKSAINKYEEGGLDVLDNQTRSDIEGECEESLKWIKKQLNSFESIEKFYECLCLVHNNIEVVKTGVVKVDTVNREYIGEKGIDIAVAIKMVKLAIGGKCDKLILISGDYDYVEAIKFVKNNVVRLNVLSFRKTKASNSTAKGLSLIADKVIEVSETDMKDRYKQVS